MKKSRLLSLCLTCFTGLSLQGQIDTAAFRLAADSIVREELEKRSSSNVAVLIQQGDTILYEGYFGEARPGRAVSEKTMFPVGSVTKVFTALAVLQLHEQGLLDIRKPISAYLPSFAPEYAPGISAPSIESILTHSSGLTENLWAASFTDKPTEDCASFMKAVSNEYIFRPEYLQRAYSNMGYDILACLIEHRSGMSYAAYLKKHIFEPLDMSSAGVMFEDTEKFREEMAFDYYADSSSSDTILFPSIPGAGSLFCSVADLNRFARALMNRDERLGKQAVNLLYEESAQKLLLPNTDTDFVLGMLRIQNASAEDSLIGPMYGHRGDLLVQHSIFTFQPFLGLSYALSTNNESGPALLNAIPWRLSKLYQKMRFPDYEQPKTKEKLAFQAIEHKKLEGLYAIGQSSSYEIDEQEVKSTFIRIKKRSKKKLRMKQGKFNLVLRQQENNIYNVKFLLFGFIPIKAKGMGMSFIEHEGDYYLVSYDAEEEELDELVAKKRVGTREAIPASFANFRGNCELIEKNFEGFVPHHADYLEQERALVLYLKDQSKKQISYMLVVTFYIENEKIALADGCLRGAWSTLRKLDNGNYSWSGFEFRVVEKN